MGRKSSSSSDDASSSDLSTDSSLSSSSSSSDSDSSSDDGNNNNNSKPACNKFFVTHDGLLTPIAINSDEELPWKTLSKNTNNLLNQNSNLNMKSNDCSDLQVSGAHQTVGSSQGNHSRSSDKTTEEVPSNATTVSEKPQNRHDQCVLINQQPSVEYTLNKEDGSSQSHNSLNQENICEIANVFRGSVNQPTDIIQKPEHNQSVLHQVHQTSSNVSKSSTEIRKTDNDNNQYKFNQIVDQVSVLSEKKEESTSIQSHLIVNKEHEKCYQVLVQNDDPLQQTIVINSFDTIRGQAAEPSEHKKASVIKKDKMFPSRRVKHILKPLQTDDTSERVADKKKDKNLPKKNSTKEKATTQKLRRSSRISGVKTDPNDDQVDESRGNKSLRDKKLSSSDKNYVADRNDDSSKNGSATSRNLPVLNQSNNQKEKVQNSRPIRKNKNVVAKTKTMSPKERKGGTESKEKSLGKISDSKEETVEAIQKSGNNEQAESLPKEEDELDTSDDESWEDINSETSVTEPSADFIARTKAMLERRKSEPGNSTEVVLPITSTPVKLKPLDQSDTEKPQINDDLSSCFSQMSIDWEKARHVFEHNSTLSPLVQAQPIKTTPMKINLKNSVENPEHIPSPVDPEIAKIFERSLLVSPCKQIARPKKPSRRVSLIKISDEAAMDFGKSPSPTTAWEMGQKLFSGKHDWKNPPTTPTKKTNFRLKAARKTLFNSDNPNMASWAKGLDGIKGDYPFSSSKLHALELSKVSEQMKETLNEKKNSFVSSGSAPIISTDNTSAGTNSSDKSKNVSSIESVSSNTSSEKLTINRINKSSPNSNGTDSSRGLTSSSNETSSGTSSSGAKHDYNSSTYIRQGTPQKSKKDDAHLFKTPTKSVRRIFKKTASGEKVAADHGSDKFSVAWSPGSKVSDQSCPYDPSEAGCYSTTVDQGSSESDIPLAPSIDTILKERQLKGSNSADSLSRPVNIQFEESGGFDVSEIETETSSGAEQNVTVCSILPKLLHGTSKEQSKEPIAKELSSGEPTTDEDLISCDSHKNILTSEKAENTSMKHVKSLFDMGDEDLDYEDTCQSPMPIKVGYGHEFVDEGEVLSEEEDGGKQEILEEEGMITLSNLEVRKRFIDILKATGSVPGASCETENVKINLSAENLSIPGSAALNSEIKDDLDILKRSKAMYEQDLKQIKQTSNKIPIVEPVLANVDNTCKDQDVSSVQKLNDEEEEKMAPYASQIKTLEAEETIKPQQSKVELPHENVLCPKMVPNSANSVPDSESGPSSIESLPTTSESSSSSTSSMTKLTKDTSPPEDVTKTTGNIIPTALGSEDADVMPMSREKQEGTVESVDLGVISDEIPKSTHDIPDDSRSNKTNSFVRNMLQADESLGLMDLSKNDTSSHSVKITETYKASGELGAFPSIESIAVNIALSSQEELGALTPKRVDYHLQETHTPLSCANVAAEMNTKTEEEAQLATKMLLLSEENADDWTPQNSMDVEASQPIQSKELISVEQQVNKKSNSVSLPSVSSDSRHLSRSQSHSGNNTVVSKPDSVKRKLSLHEYVTIKENSQKHKQKVAHGSTKQEHVEKVMRPVMSAKIKYHFVIPITVPPKPFLYPRRVEQIQTKLINELIDGIDFATHPPITTPSYMKLRKTTPLEEKEDPLAAIEELPEPDRREIIVGKSNDVTLIRRVNDDKNIAMPLINDAAPKTANDIVPASRNAASTMENSGNLPGKLNKVDVKDYQKKESNLVPCITPTSERDQNSKGHQHCKMSDVVAIKQIMSNVLAQNSYNPVPSFLDEESHEYFKHVKIPKVKRVTDPFVSSTSLLDCSNDTDMVQKIVQSSFATENPAEELNSLAVSRDPRNRASNNRQAKPSEESSVKDSSWKQTEQPLTPKMVSCSETLKHDFKRDAANCVKLVNSRSLVDDKRKYNLNASASLPLSKTSVTSKARFGDELHSSPLLKPPEIEPRDNHKVEPDVITVLHEQKSFLVSESETNENAGVNSLEVSSTTNVKLNSDTTNVRSMPEDLNVSRHHPVRTAKLGTSFRIPKKSKSSAVSQCSETLTGTNSIVSFLSSDSSIRTGQTLFTQRKKKQLDEIILKEREEKQKMLRELLDSELLEKDNSLESKQEPVEKDSAAENSSIKEDSSKRKRKKTTSPEKVQNFDLRKLLSRTSEGPDKQEKKRIKTKNTDLLVDSDCQLNFFSSFFDPIVALNFKSSRVKLPDRKCSAFDSLSQWLVAWREAELQLKNIRTVRLKIRNAEYEPRDTSKLQLSKIELSKSELKAESNKLKTKREAKNKPTENESNNSKLNDPSSYGWKTNITETVFQPFFDKENQVIDTNEPQKLFNSRQNPLLRKAEQKTSICSREKINLPKLWSDCITRADAAHRDYKRKRKPTVLDTMAMKESGPFSTLQKALISNSKVTVVTRSFKGVRGQCTGYLIAYDKHMNMALSDVSEFYRSVYHKPQPQKTESTHSLAVDPILISQIRSPSESPPLSLRQSRSSSESIPSPSQSPTPSTPSGKVSKGWYTPPSGLLGWAYHTPEYHKYKYTTHHILERHSKQILLRGDNVVLVQLQD